MSGHLQVKNWKEFQHYTNRNPPWIKLYNRVLDDYQFACLPDASKAHLVCIWMLASRGTSDGVIPNDPEWVAARIAAREPVDLSTLVDAGFLQVVEPQPLPKRNEPVEQNASVLLAERYPSRTPAHSQETETETETELTDGASAHVENSRDRILGRSRELGFPVDGKLAGMVNRWLGNGKSEAVITFALEGLALLYRDGKLEPPMDLRPLYAKDSARTWAWAEQRANDQHKRLPKRGGSTPGEVIFGRSA